MKRIALSIAVLLLVFPLITCDIEGGAADSAPGKGGSPYAPPAGGGYHDAETGIDGPGGKEWEPGSGGGGRPQAGQLTSGEWSDIKNYDFYRNLFTIESDTDPEIAGNQRRSGYADYIEYFGFETRYMVTVTVLCAESPVGDAAVELYDAGETLLFAAKTGVNGGAYLFPPYDLNGDTITIKAISGGNEASVSFVYARENVQISLESREEAQPVLDLMFVVDTTGSMGDEIRYLKSEIEDVIGKISSGNPNYTINLALLFYRDIGDEYVTRYFDFTANISRQQQELSRQSASGGGDFPEASDRALEEAAGKNWNDNAVRLMFHVCDAPPHSDQESQTRYGAAVREAAKKGIRIIPVASSGIDLATEYLLRQEALITGGTYIFLTDDSGIGESHLQPTVGEYTVEYLNACMVRIVSEYLSGVETEPVPYY